LMKFLFINLLIDSQIINIKELPGRPLSHKILRYLIDSIGQIDCHAGYCRLRSASPCQGILVACRSKAKIPSQRGCSVAEIYPPLEDPVIGANERLYNKGGMFSDTRRRISQ
jgi:hypothetical protein